MFTETGFRLAGFTFGWYSVLVVVAVFVAAIIATRLANRAGLDPERVWQALIPASLLGLIGARLGFVCFPPQSVVANGRTAAWLLTNFFDLNQGGIAVWLGGLGILGGMAGGVVGLWLYTRWTKQPFLAWLDIAAVVFPFGQAIGRLGNGINQELYGPVTTLPWGVPVTIEAQRVAPYTDLTAYPLATTLFHPVFLYESLLCLTIFALLLTLWLRRRPTFHAGTLTLIYLALYGGGRFLLEFWRVNVALVANVNISQMVSVVVALISLALLIRRSRQPTLRYDESTP